MTFEQNLAESVAVVIRAALKPRDERIAELSARLSALESAPKAAGVHWLGIWETHKGYGEGALVTKSGGLWLRTSSDDRERSAPGESPNWKLVVKRGAFDR